MGQRVNYEPEGGRRRVGYRHTIRRYSLNPSNWIHINAVTSENLSTHHHSIRTLPIHKVPAQPPKTLTLEYLTLLHSSTFHPTTKPRTLKSPPSTPLLIHKPVMGSSTPYFRNFLHATTSQQGDRSCDTLRWRDGWSETTQETDRYN